MAVPEISAASAIVVNLTIGQVLYARNEHARRAPASLVKLVTAMVTLQRSRLDKEFTVFPDDLSVYSPNYLQNGERLNVRELLFMLLISSDNVAAVTLARSIGRDVGTFVGWMNDLAAGWGLKDTRFANPHGYDSRSMYSSAFDMAVIAYHALSDPVIADIVKLPEIVMAGRRIQSTNRLLNSYSGMAGLKTGTTDQAGECYIAVVNRPAGRVLVVLLGSKDRFTDARLLLDYFYANYAELRIDMPPSAQNRYLDEQNGWHDCSVRAPLTLLVKPWQVSSASFYRRIDDLRVAPPPDQPVGALTVQLAGHPLTEVPIYAR